MLYHHTKAKGNKRLREQHQPLRCLSCSTPLPQVSSKHPEPSVLQDAVTPARAGAGCTCLPWHLWCFQQEPMNSDSFRLVSTEANEMSQGQHRNVTFWPGSCESCRLSASEGCSTWEGKAGQGAWKRGDRSFLCSVTRPPFPQPVPFYKGF